MMNTTMVDFPLAMESSQERSPEMDTRLCVNYYVTYDKGGVKPIMWNPTPGWAAKYVLSGSSNAVRAIYSDENSAYSFCLAISGDTIYSLGNGIRSTPIGQLRTSGGFVGITGSTTQVLIVDGAAGYVYNIAAQTITQITDDNFPSSPLDCVFFNGYFYVCEAGSNQWFYSDAGNALSWPDGNGIVLNAKADTFAGIAATNNSLFIIGNYITEIWYSQANGTAPVTYNTNMLFEVGCAATGSIAEGPRDEKGILVWLGGDKDGVGSIYMTSGSEPQKISTQAIDLKLRSLATVNDAIGYLYKEAGHIFYVLTFPTENLTLQCDLTSTNAENRWSYLESLNGDAYIGSCHTYYKSQHLIGSRESSAVHLLSYLIPTEGGNTVHRYIQGGSLMLPSYNRIIVNNFEVNFSGGSGNVNQPGLDPLVFLSVSTDEGHTFNLTQRKAEIGRMGEYKYRAQWYGIGLTRSFTPRIDVYAPVTAYILGAKIVYSVGRC